MLVRKSLTIAGIWQFAGHHLYWLSAWMLLVTALYQFTGWQWITIPWLPISVVGTAVAFYVGFKNNQAYDRLWEGRKIWGSIINSSRAWGSMVKSYVKSDAVSESQLFQLKQSLVYRHIGWVYKLREQLLVPTPWEHVSLGWRFGSFNQSRREHFGDGAFKDELETVNQHKYIPIEEDKRYAMFANASTQIIDKQSQELSRLNEEGLLDLLRQIEMQKILNEFFDHQGRAERIKKFPLPRQYGSLSFLFVCIFIFLLPFGIVGEFSKHGIGVWLGVPFGVLIGWVYVVMELIGDYSENPFEGLFNDVPMLSICRTIEIDLLQMLGESEVPAAVQPRNGILM